ncbi:MAG: hypothetical protein JW384_01748 [Nitrosomonadaceae bacterium]|nr:hypothetical protein [Nitrosomonadaceae bacterium]
MQVLLSILIKVAQPESPQFPSAEILLWFPLIRPGLRALTCPLQSLLSTPHIQRESPERFMAVNPSRPLIKNRGMNFLAVFLLRMRCLFNFAPRITTRLLSTNSTLGSLVLEIRHPLVRRDGFTKAWTFHFLQTRFLAPVGRVQVISNQRKVDRLQRNLTKQLSVISKVVETSAAWFLQTRRNTFPDRLLSM